MTEQQINLNKPAGILIKSTCVDYPGILAGSFFLKGCNLRCPYCYNKILVQENSPVDELQTLQDLFSHLEKRQGILKGLVISGGEPLLNPYTPFIIKKAKELNYKIKLDTNGTFPEKLEEFIENPELKPDFIALDLKTSPQNYKTLICGKNSIYFEKEGFFEEVLEKSVKLISKLDADCREVRTVLVPGLISSSDIKKIAEMLPQNMSWQFAQFRNENCLDSSYNQILPYSDKEAEELVNYARTLIPGACLR